MSYLFSYESSLVLPAVAWSKFSIWGSREKSRESSTRKETLVRLVAIRGELASRLFQQLSLYGLAATRIN